MALDRDPRQSLIRKRLYWALFCALAILVMIAVAILLSYGVVFALFPVVLAAAAILVIFYFLSQGGLRVVKDAIQEVAGDIDPRPPSYQMNQPYGNPYGTHPPQGYAPPPPGRCRYCGGQLYQGHPNCPHCGELVHGPP